jgi:glycerol kinase
MSEKFVLALDQGTTGSTALLIDEQLSLRAKATCEFPQIYPQPGWVEHDPEAIWESITKAMAQAIEGARIEASQIAAIGITNQRETTVVWDKHSGKPLYNAIVWQDRRTTDRCEALAKQGLTSLYRQRTGLVLDPYFSGTKLAWLLDHCEGARQLAATGKLAFGTIDSYLIARLSGFQVHVTDPSNASRTLLYNIVDQRWDEQLLAPLSIPREILPEVKSNSEIYGETRGVAGLPDGIPIAGAAGDQQAALFGQTCFAPGEAKCTYGTGAFLLVNTGEQAIITEGGTLATIGWRVGDTTTYALEGSAFIAGAAVQWLRDGLGLIGRAADVETLAANVDDTDGLVFVPALVGLGAPHWKPNARGVIAGITRGTTAAHLARATLEGIAFQIYDLAESMAQAYGKPIETFKVDGGATANNLLMQFQADLLDLPLVRPEITETTALGAGLLAGLAAGIWSDLDAIRSSWRQECRFLPKMDEARRTSKLQLWKRAVTLA